MKPWSSSLKTIEIEANFAFWHPTHSAGFAKHAYVTLRCFSWVFFGEKWNWSILNTIWKHFFLPNPCGNHAAFERRWRDFQVFWKPLPQVRMTFWFPIHDRPKWEECRQYFHRVFRFHVSLQLRFTVLKFSRRNSSNTFFYFKRSLQ